MDIFRALFPLARAVPETMILREGFVFSLYHYTPVPPPRRSARRSALAGIEAPAHASTPFTTSPLTSVSR